MLVIDNNTVDKINSIIKIKTNDNFKDLTLTELDDIYNHRKTERSREVVTLADGRNFEYLTDLIFQISKVMKYY